MNQKKKYKVIGVAEFVTQLEYMKLGYLEDIEQHPVFVYERVDKDAIEGIKFWKHETLTLEQEYMVIYEHMIKNTYSLEEAEELFPELYL